MNKNERMRYLIAGIGLMMNTAMAQYAGASAVTPAPVLPLAHEGKTAYTIALASDAIPSEKTAAAQLQKYLQQVTGASFLIQSENEVKTNAPQIYVGAGSQVKVLLPGQDWDSLGNDGIVIKTVGNDLILAGGRPRGTLYAVYQFLEDAVGCRWWTPTENTIPHKSTFMLPPQNVVYVPPFNYREHYTNSVMESPEFATILRENGHHQRQTAAWGGHYTMIGFVHTFSQFLPPSKYFKDHPEWYSDPANGNVPCTVKSKMPAPQTTQLCMSNPEVIDAMAKEALERIAQNPQAGYISISQNDNTNYCRCPQCLKTLEEEGSESGPILKFVNAVAAKIHKKYPDVLVETLAYHQTQKPPKTIRPAANVIVRFAPDQIDSGHPINSNWNKEEQNNLIAWSKISSQLFVWNYVTNFVATTMPHPNINNFGVDLQFLADHKVKGIFEQGDQYTGGVGDFVQLRTWLLGKLMWNPQLDINVLTDAFLKGYYGDASPFLKQYLELVRKAFLADNRKLPKYTKDFSYLSLDVMNDATRLFNAAADATKNNPTFSERVRRTRLTLDYAWLYRYKILCRASQKTGQQFLGPDNPQQAMEEYIKTAQHFKIRSLSMGHGFSLQIPKLRKMFFGVSVPLPEFVQQYPTADVIDLQQGDFSLLPPYAKIIDDPAASDKMTASLLGSTKPWAVQVHLGKILDRNESWHVYALMRVKPKAGAALNSPCFEFGVYDFSHSKYISRRTVKLDGISRSEQYVPVDLGEYTLNGGMYFWVVPKQPAPAEEIYLDRIILIHE